MRWPAAVFLFAACAVGCRNSSSTFDPFLPSRRIPAPGTGAASGTPDPYYSPSTSYGGGAPAYQPPPAGVPATGGGTGPFAPSTYPQGSPTPAPVNGGFGAVPGPVSNSQVLPSRNSGPQAAKASYVTTTDDEPSAVYERRRPAAASTASAGSSSAPARSLTGASSKAIDLMDLPPVVASR